MNRSRIDPSLLSLATAVVLVAACAASAALAATGAGSPQARYAQERATCEHSLKHQNRASCLSQAKSAYDGRRGVQEIDVDRSVLEVNARKRCEPLPLSDRLACLGRMDGLGLTLGSVQEGGIYRELRVLEVRVPTPPEVNSQQSEPES